MNRHYNRTAVFLLLLLGVFPQILLLVESMDCRIRPHLGLWILGICAAMWLTAVFRRGLLFGMPLAAILLYAAYRRFQPEPIAELNDLLDRITGAYYTHFYSSGGEYAYLNAVEDHSFIVLLLAFLLAAYLSAALTSQSGRRVFSLLGSVPAFALCLAVNGRPSYSPVVMMLLFWALVLLGGGRYQMENGGGKAALICLLPLTLLLAGLLWFSDPAGYRFDDQDIVKSRQFDWIGDWISRWIDEHFAELPLPGPETIYASPDSMLPPEEKLLWEAAEGGMDLTQTYDPTMLDRVFLRVRSQEDGLLYLRSVSYGSYGGDSWGPAENAPQPSLGFTAEAIGAAEDQRRMEIENTAALRFACLPYYSPLSGEDDAFVPAQLRGSDHPVYRRPSGSLPERSDAREEELLYRSFAHEYYTRLPEPTRSQLRALAGEAGLYAEDPELIAKVAAYVQGAGEYDLETEPYPGTDYAVYFLTQAHRGYCVHFATAAAALYRALGVPARVTEGFLITSVSGRTLEVRGESAHAWVEVYRDGVGWIPVEVTGRSGLRPEEETELEGTQEEAAPETPPPQEAPGENEATVIPPGGTGEDGQAPPLPVGIIAEQEDAGVGARSAGRQLRRILTAALLLALLASLFPLRRRLMRLRLQQLLRSPDRSRAAVALWKRARALERFGASVPAELVRCAEKACFSAQGVDAEELAACAAIFDEATRRLSPKLSSKQRFLFRYFYGFE